MYIAFTSPPFVPNFLSNLYRDFRVESFSKIRSMTFHTFCNWQISFSFDTLAPLFPRPLLWKTHVILFYSPILLLPDWWQHVFLFLHTFFLAHFRLFQVDRKFISRGKKRKKKNMCRETKDTRIHTYTHIYIHIYRLKSSVPCFEKGVCFKVTWNFDS